VVNNLESEAKEHHSQLDRLNSENEAMERMKRELEREIEELKSANERCGDDVVGAVAEMQGTMTITQKSGCSNFLSDTLRLMNWLLPWSIVSETPSQLVVLHRTKAFKVVFTGYSFKELTSKGMKIELSTEEEEKGWAPDQELKSTLKRFLYSKAKLAAEAEFKGDVRVRLWVLFP
jgi:hypothetical protein